MTLNEFEWLETVDTGTVEKISDKNVVGFAKNLADRPLTAIVMSPDWREIAHKNVLDYFKKRYKRDRKIN